MIIKDYIILSVKKIIVHYPLIECSDVRFNSDLNAFKICLRGQNKKGDWCEQAFYISEANLTKKNFKESIKQYIINEIEKAQIFQKEQVI